MEQLWLILYCCATQGGRNSYHRPAATCFTVTLLTAALAQKGVCMCHCGRLYCLWASHLLARHLMVNDCGRVPLPYSVVAEGQLRLHGAWTLY